MSHWLTQHENLSQKGNALFFSFFLFKGCIVNAIEAGVRWGIWIENFPQNFFSMKKACLFCRKLTFSYSIGIVFWLLLHISAWRWFLIWMFLYRMCCWNAWQQRLNLMNLFHTPEMLTDTSLLPDWRPSGLGNWGNSKRGPSKLCNITRKGKWSKFLFPYPLCPSSWGSGQAEPWCHSRWYRNWGLYFKNLMTFQFISPLWQSLLTPPLGNVFCMAAFLN